MTGRNKAAFVTEPGYLLCTSLYLFVPAQRLRCSDEACVIQFPDVLTLTKTTLQPDCLFNSLLTLLEPSRSLTRGANLRSNCSPICTLANNEHRKRICWNLPPTGNFNNCSQHTFFPLEDSLLFYFF